MGVPAISKQDMQINEMIRDKEILVIDADGTKLGVMSAKDAQKIAYDKNLDLVKIAPQAKPPVCRVMDYGKYCFERDKKAKEARKKQQIVKVKEVQLSCRIDTHDFETRVNHARKFLSGGDKVRAVIRFKGREMAHKDLGREVLLKFQQACDGYGTTEKPPVEEGRFMSIVLNPVKQ